MTKEELMKFVELAKKFSEECLKAECVKCPFCRDKIKLQDDSVTDFRCELCSRPHAWKLDDIKISYELKINKVYTLDEFRETFLKGNFDEESLDYTRHREFRNFLDSNGYFDIWDYPMHELDYLIEERKKVVPVTDGREIRFYEIEMED